MLRVGELVVYVFDCFAFAFDVKDDDFGVFVKDRHEFATPCKLNVHDW